MINTAYRSSSILHIDHHHCLQDILKHFEFLQIPSFLSWTDSRRQFVAIVCVVVFLVGLSVFWCFCLLLLLLLYLFLLLLFLLLFSDHVFVSNQPKCRPERKTAKLVSPDESSEWASRLTCKHANSCWMSTSCFCSGPIPFLSASHGQPRSPSCSLFFRSLRWCHTSVAPPPALVYLHIRLNRCLLINFYLLDEASYLKTNRWSK